MAEALRKSGKQAAEACHGRDYAQGQRLRGLPTGVGGEGRGAKKSPKSDKAAHSLGWFADCAGLRRLIAGIATF